MHDWDVTVEFTNGNDWIKYVRADNSAEAVGIVMGMLSSSGGENKDKIDNIKVKMAEFRLSRAAINLLLFADGENEARFVWGVRSYIFQSIERESGNGKTFNVRALDDDGKPVTLFCRVR